MRRCSRMIPSKGNCCFVAVRSAESSFLFFRFRHSSGIVDEWIRFTSVPVSRRYIAVYITFVVCPYNIQSLYIDFAVSAMLFSCEVNPSGSVRETAHSRGFFIISSSAPTLGKKKYPRKCVLTGVRSRFAGGASLIFCTTDRAGVAFCTLVRRAIIPQILLQRHSCFSLSG